jgi:hypothetical protein
MKTNLLTILLLIVVAFTNAQNDNLRQYLYTQKDYVNNQLRNRDSMVTTYPNLSESLKSEDTWFLWNIPGQSYINDKRYTYTYNTAGQTTEYKTSEWDGSNWANIKKWNYTYNTQGSIILNSAYYFQNGNWIEQSRGEWTYNSQGSMIEYQGSDTVGGSLSVKFRNVYTIDALQRTKESVEQNRISGNWVNNNREVYFFKGNATLIDSTYHYNWNSSNSIWTPSFKIIYKHNAQGLETEYYRFNLVSNKPQLKTVRDYTSFGKELYSENYQWDNNNNQWYLGSKNTTAYDSKNREVESIFYNGSPSGLKFNSKTDVIYAADSSSVQFIGSTWINNGWQPNAEYTYYFEQRQSATSLSDVRINTRSAYPNPFSINTVIDFEVTHSGEAKVLIVDLSGKTVFEKQLYVTSGENTFLWEAQDSNGNTLSAGVYVMRMASNGRILTQNLIKQ